MSFGIYLRKFLGLDHFDDYLWVGINPISNLKENTIVHATKVITGNSSCNLILKPEVNIDIIGDFSGKIVGLGSNTVRINGEFEGMISCSKLIILSGSKIIGKFHMNQFSMENEDNLIIDAELMSFIELVPFYYSPDKIDFDYIERI